MTTIFIALIGGIGGFLYGKYKPYSGLGAVPAAIIALLSAGVVSWVLSFIVPPAIRNFAMLSIFGWGAAAAVLWFIDKNS